MDLSRDNIQQLYRHLQILNMCREIIFLTSTRRYVYDTRCHLYAYSEFILLALTGSDTDQMTYSLNALSSVYMYLKYHQ